MGHFYFEPDVQLCPECQVVQPSYVMNNNGHDDDTIYREYTLYAFNRALYVGKTACMDESGSESRN